MSAHHIYIWLLNIPPTATQRHIKALFEVPPPDSNETIKFSTGQVSICGGNAFVLASSADECKKALLWDNLQIHGQPIRIRAIGYPQMKLIRDGNARRTLRFPLSNLQQVEARKIRPICVAKRKLSHNAAMAQWFQGPEVDRRSSDKENRTEGAAGKSEGRVAKRIRPTPLVDLAETSKLFTL